MGNASAPGCLVRAGLAMLMCCADGLMRWCGWRALFSPRLPSHFPTFLPTPFQISLAKGGRAEPGFGVVGRIAPLDGIDAAILFSRGGREITEEIGGEGRGDGR